MSMKTDISVVSHCGYKVSAGWSRFIFSNQIIL